MAIIDNIPIDVVPTVAYGDELIGKANPGSGINQYSGGKTVYSRLAPGTKTLAAKQAEAEKAKALSSALTTTKAVPVVATPKIAAGGSLTQWLQQALELTGQDQTALPYLQTIAMKESSGRADAINEWDSNWKAGTPSKGLMQTIDSTFNAYKLPGHDDIWNPVDNAAAAIRYAISRYGSLENVPGIKAMAKGGKYVGY